MPGFPSGATRRIMRSYTLQFVDTTGARGSTSVSGFSSDTTAAELTALRDGVANCSNAGLLAANTSARDQISITEATAYDEAQSSVTTKGVFVFQDGNFDQVSISVPAPDDSMLSADGQTIDPANTQAAALIAAALTVLNKPEGAGAAGTYAFVRGYFSTSRGAPKFNPKPIITESGAGDNPPPEPGV